MKSLLIGLAVVNSWCLNVCVADQISQSYDDYKKNISWKYDDAIVPLKGIVFEPSREIDMSKSPFKAEIKRYKVVHRKLVKEALKMKKRYSRNGSVSRETVMHEKLRLQEKKAKKLIVWRYNVLCRSKVPQLKKIGELVRDAEKKINQYSLEQRVDKQEIIDRLRGEYQAIIQDLVDNVFVYAKFPVQGTWDNTLYPIKYRNFYKKIAGYVEKSIAKGGGVAVEERSDDEDDEVETTGKYDAMFTETTSEFLSEHFDAVPSSKFRPERNPFKKLHKNRIRKLALLEKSTSDMDGHLKRKGGRYRETAIHQSARLITKSTGEAICRKFHRILKPRYLKFERNALQVRQLIRLLDGCRDDDKRKIYEQKYQKYVKAGNKILQSMIDDVFAYEPWPENDEDNKIDSKYRSFYKTASKMFYEG